MIVRPGFRADLPHVYALVKLAHAEAPRYNQHPLSMEKIESLGELTQEDPNFFLLVAENDGCIVGYLAGAITPSHFSDITQACSISLYVAPERRGSRAAYMLLRALAEVGAGLGATEACISVSSGICVEQTVRLAEKLGFVNYGHSLVKQLCRT